MTEYQEHMTGTLSFKGSDEEQREAAIDVICGLMEHYDISREEVGF